MTYSNLDKFANTNQKNVNDRKSMLLKTQEEEQKNDSLHHDENTDLKLINQLPKNEKYQGIVKNKLLELKFFTEFWKILNDMEINNSDCRAFFVETINMMYMFDGKTNILGDEVEKKQKINDLKNYFIIVIKLNKNKNYSGSNDYEV